MPVLASEETARMEASIETPPPPVEAVELTVVMPCLNEERTVGTCVTKAVQTMRALGIRGEVRLDAIEEIHVDRVHVLDLDPTARLGLEPGGDLV